MFVYVYNHYKIKHSFENLLINIKDESNNNIVTKIDVTFERKFKIYTKNIYIIMNKEMEFNITNKNNSQYFTESTYYAISPYNKGSKLWIHLGFNKEFMKNLLCCIAIIKNENKETIIRIFDYLTKKKIILFLN